MSTPTTTPSADWSGLDDAPLRRRGRHRGLRHRRRYESSEPVILRANDYLDVRGAVASALDAIQFPHVEYNTVELAAHYSIRGAHLDEGTTHGKLTDALRGGLEPSRDHDRRRLPGRRPDDDSRHRADQPRSTMRSKRRWRSTPSTRSSSRRAEGERVARYQSRSQQSAGQARAHEGNPSRTGSSPQETSRLRGWSPWSTRPASSPTTPAR